MRSRLERSQQFGLMLAKSRNDAGFTQKQMAQALGKSVNTIQNWESGVGSPNYLDLEDWFATIGMNMHSYMYDYDHPDMLSPIDQSTPVPKLLESLNQFFSALPEVSIRKFAFNIFSRAGADFKEQNNMIYLHNITPLFYRINVAVSVRENYKMAEARNELLNKNEFPDSLDQLETVIEAAKESAYSGKQGYHVGKL